MSLPLWSALAAAIGTPLLAFVGSLLGPWITRKNARELEARSRREEMMRTLRWAAELAVSDDERRAELGVAELAALGESAMLDGDQQVFIDSALKATIGDAADDIGTGGPDPEVRGSSGEGSEAREVTGGELAWGSERAEDGTDG